MSRLWSRRHESVLRLGNLAVFVVALVAPGTPAAAQRMRPTLDAGAVGMRYADSVRMSALSSSPAMRADWPRATLGAGGSYAQLAGSGWSTQGVLDAALYTPRAGPLSAALAGAAGGSAHWDGTHTGQSAVIGRVHLDGGEAGG